MRIGIDCRLWNETGVGRYTRNLVTNLARLDKKNDYVLFAKSEDEKAIKSVVSGQWSVVTTDVSWHGLQEQIRLPKILNDQNLDLMHFPYLSVPIFYNKPYVVTVHDLIINRFATGRASTLPLPVYFAKRVGYHAVLANAVYRSKKIIVPSNAVKTDLLRTYRNVSSDKVEVTYEGGFDIEIKNKKLNIKDENKELVEGKYLIRVGNFYPHKNVERLLLAFHDFVYSDYDNHAIKLVLVGKRDYFSKRIEKQIELLNMSSNVVFYENAKDVDLISLYQNAIATIIPSFAEGFSLTAVESMSLGTPVVASDIPVHREICGSAAIYCNPADINDMNQKINFACSLVEDSRKELIEQGKKQAKNFSWRKMAEDTLKIYNSITP